MNSSLLTRKIDLYVNERYSPFSGWSVRGLLITDRGAYSTQDGNVSFSNIDEANAAFLSPGWYWTTDWERDLSITNFDENGWSYAADFVGFEDEKSGSAVKSMIHLVRRKRMTRYQAFDANKIYLNVNSTCDFCDLEETDRLATLLLDIITTSSLIKHPRYISVPKINSIKNDLIQVLNFSSTPSVPYSTNNIRIMLEALINMGKNLSSMASAAVSHGNSTEYHSKRLVEISAEFSLEERLELAKLIIRKYDIFYEFHCNVKNCSSVTAEPSDSTAAVVQCVFIPQKCPNNDCNERFSAKWFPRHDNICPEKIVPCERACGEYLMRKLLPEHLEISCVERPVPCSFHSLGCGVVCPYRSLQEHLDSFVSSHLLLSLTRIEEQNKVIISLHRKQQQVEQHITDLDSRHSTVTGALAASIAAVELSEKKNNKSLHDEIQKLDSKISKVQSELTSSLKTEVSGLKKNINTLMLSLEPGK